MHRSIVLLLASLLLLAGCAAPSQADPTPPASTPLPANIEFLDVPAPEPADPRQVTLLDGGFMTVPPGSIVQAGSVFVGNSKEVQPTIVVNAEQLSRASRGLPTFLLTIAPAGTEPLLQIDPATGVMSGTLPLASYKTMSRQLAGIILIASGFSGDELLTALKEYEATLDEHHFLLAPINSDGSIIPLPEGTWAPESSPATPVPGPRLTPIPNPLAG